MFRPQSVLDSISYVEDEDRTESGLRLNLDISRKIAKDKIKLQRKLALLLRKEVNSELLE
jgi:hypothetical protein